MLKYNPLPTGSGFFCLRRRTRGACSNQFFFHIFSFWNPGVLIMCNRRLVNKCISTVLLCGFFVSLSFLASCKKRRAFNEENAQEPYDAGMFRAEGDAAMEDVNNAVSNQFLLRGKPVSMSESEDALTNTPCGLTVDTSDVSGGVIILNYNGAACNNRIREGSIKVTLQDYPLKKWKQKGAILKVDFNAFKVTGVNDGKSIKVDGTLFVTNESGSTWYDMRYLNVSTVINSVSGNDLRLTFHDGSNMSLNVKRRYTYTISGKVISCMLEGLGEQDSKTGVESWGRSREGNDFTSAIVTPIVWNTTCGSIMPTDGEMKVNVHNKYFELTCNYGCDASGNSPDGSACPYGWKVTWSYKKKTSKRIFPYSR
jgi:hypothetical protein